MIYKGAARPKLGGHEYGHHAKLRVFPWCMTIYRGVTQRSAPSTILIGLGTLLCTKQSVRVCHFAKVLMPTDMTWDDEFTTALIAVLYSLHGRVTCACIYTILAHFGLLIVHENCHFWRLGGHDRVFVSMALDLLQMLSRHSQIWFSQRNWVFYRQSLIEPVKRFHSFSIWAIVKIY